MWILALVLLILGALWIRKLSRALLICAGIAFFGLLLIGVHFWRDGAEPTRRREVSEAERRAARSRIAVGEVELDRPRLDRISLSSGPSMVFRSRIRNHSMRYAISGLTLELTYRDCMKGIPCEIVAVETISTARKVPPGQARDEEVFLSSFPDSRHLRGKFRWTYRLIGTTGQETAKPSSRN
jgi:hypothetical protein